MGSFEELNSTREKLMEALGDKRKQYIQHMKSWFQLKCTKEQFDFEVKKFLDTNQKHLHNKFLLQLFIKCSKQNLPSSLNLSYNHGKGKRRARQQGIGFQPVNVHEYAQTRIPQRITEEPIRYCLQELILPDQELIHMRLMLTAWELGLKGAEQSAAELLVVAVQHFLRNIVGAVLSQRSGFRVQDNRFQHCLGMPVPNPWLRNTAGFLSHRNDRSVTDVVDNGESVPVSRPSISEMKQDIVLTYATSISPAKKYPITVAECFQALQVYRSTIPSHGVYTINMERISNQMSHKSYDDLGG